MSRITFTWQLAAKVAEGTKTQTRRLVTRGSSKSPHPSTPVSQEWESFAMDLAYADGASLCSPSGASWRYRLESRRAPGDVLDVCESFVVVDVSGYSGEATVVHGPTRLRDPDWRALTRRESPAALKVRWRSGRFMPAWAVDQRIRVTAVRPERLLDITEADARAEGFDDRSAFLAAWDRINKSAPAAGSPWVWVISFERVAP